MGRLLDGRQRIRRGSRGEGGGAEEASWGASLAALKVLRRRWRAVSCRQTMEWFRPRRQGWSAAGDSVIEGERLTREKRM